MTEFNKSEYFTNLESDLWKEEAEKGGKTKEEKEEKRSNFLSWGAILP